MKHSDFLFELGVEELPSKAVAVLSEGLRKNIAAGLHKANIRHAEIEYFGSPRRIAVIVRDVANFQDPQQISRRGPAVAGSIDANNNPRPSLLGFAKSCDVDISALSKVTTSKGDWWLYEAELPGAKTQSLLLEIVQEALSKLPIVKPMSWGEGIYNFSRPVHWVVMLFADEVIPGEIFGVQTGRDSYGHRFHHPHKVYIDNPDSYVAALHAAKVVVEYSKRRTLILQQLQTLSKERGLLPVIADELLDEVTSIVEWPNAILASFAEEFLQVPCEVIIESLQQHQKCFPLKDKHGNLSPYFITVLNIVSKDPERVRLGNEKVVKARLSDAMFFYSQDSKQPLANYTLSMDKIVFHAKLGSLADKVRRMARIMKYLAPHLGFATLLGERASLLAKCDLLTGMVGEFPELQGVMGYYYAQKDGEKAEVALAIKEHYYPRFADDELPTSVCGSALSIADRIDNLVGLFAIKQKPTGVKDPFKLRRHALALVRILLNLNCELSLRSLIVVAVDNYADVVAVDKQEIMQSLLAFIFERMQSYYQAQNIENHFFLAVKAQQHEYLCDMDARIRALLHFQEIPEAVSLAAACKRVDNMLADVTEDVSNSVVQVEIMTEVAEKALYEQMLTVENIVIALQEQSDYQNILTNLATLKEPLDMFFNDVMVMVADAKVKLNRLCLLVRLQKLLKTVADIGLINF